jgi:hypothetical protein
MRTFSFSALSAPLRLKKHWCNSTNKFEDELGLL